MEEKEEIWREPLYKAFDSFEEKRYDDSLIFLDQAVKAGWESYEQYTFRANCYFEMNEFEKAIEYFTVYLNIVNDDGPMHWNRGLAYFNLNNFKASLADFEASLLDTQVIDNTYYYIGVCKSFLEDHEGAVYNLYKAEELGCNHNLLFRFRGISNFQLCNYEQAKADLLKFVLFDPMDHTSYFVLGGIEDRKGNYEEALNHFSHAIFIFGEERDYYIERMYLYLKMNQKEKAKEDFLKIMDISLNGEVMDLDTNHPEVLAMMDEYVKKNSNENNKQG
jgi:tetratricopeptide (TPR) repeat protein